MDNVFEILIYVIIIISFLSSIFKKKKQQQQRPPAQQPQSDDYYQAKVELPKAEKKEEYDIMRELEDFFKVGNEPTESSIPEPQTQTEIAPSMEEHLKTDSWHTQTKSEHVVDQWEQKRSEVKKILGSVDSAIEKKAAMFEESLGKKEAIYNSLALAVKSKMKTPSTLKEYIIFSEILGKPKALRR